MDLTHKKKEKKKLAQARVKYLSNYIRKFITSTNAGFFHRNKARDKNAFPRGNGRGSEEIPGKHIMYMAQVTSTQAKLFWQ